MTPSPFAVHLLFASATGTAEDLAHTLAESLLPHFHPHSLSSSPSQTLPPPPYLTCSPLDHYPLHQLPHNAAQHHIFLFIISTCGDGDVPPNMRQFWRFIRRIDLPPRILADLRFAIFGLGDRAYLKFNAAARKLYRRLSDLAASPVAPLALGDESAHGGLDTELWPWWRRVCDALRARCELPPDVGSRVGFKPGLTSESRVTVEVVGRVDERLRNAWRAGQVNAAFGQARGGVGCCDTTVLENGVMTDSKHLTDDREVRHIVLDLSHAPPTSPLHAYAPGDVVHVLPRNRDSAVDALFELTGWDPRMLVNVRGDAGRGTRFGVYPVRVCTPCCLWEFVATHMDLSGTPRRKFFERLAPFAKDSREQDKLIELASVDGAEMLTQYSYRERRTVLMVLRDFPSARPPVEHLIDMIPVLKARAFSIASSPHAYPGQIHICAAMVQYTTPLRFLRVGVCSAFFRSLRVGDVVPVFWEEGSSLRFTQNVPSILIGPGTGVAPMRSFVSSCSGDGVERILFFGCRSSKGDFLYERDWEMFLETGSLTSVTTAFSRESERKVYVQHKMLENSGKLWDLVSVGGAKVYLAGATGSMPKAVRRTLVEICEGSGKLKAEDAEAFIQKMEAEGRLQMECW